MMNPSSGLGAAGRVTTGLAGAASIGLLGSDANCSSAGFVGVLSTTGFDVVVTGLTGASLTGGLFEPTGGADTNTGDTTGSSADVDFTKAGGALAISRGLASDLSLGVGAAMTARLSAFPTVDGVP